ncbi:sarcosine oxidase subunit delta, partial [Dermacoccus nishinomiyaensis]|uniref:sarcosine oxidase subunit delta n=1 Tax=Dermacoccus nishinomiyaensis TaxID=1274 RepID=UPI00248F3B7C
MRAPLRASAGSAVVVDDLLVFLRHRGAALDLDDAKDGKSRKERAEVAGDVVRRLLVPEIDAAVETVRPAADASQDAWFDYVYLRDNIAGDMTEHWYHGGGCRSWLRCVTEIRPRPAVDGPAL